MLEIGRVVERYRVEALLGEGGTATVYRVRHVTLDTLHALKVLAIAHRSVRERFITEGRVQAALRHPHAVAVQDVFEVDGVLCLLLEYVDGPDLGRWIEEQPYDLSDVEAIFRGILAAVAAAHALGLVHRDLKPANVLMAREDDRWVPKVADFGIAKLLADGRESDGRTRTGVAMGTPSWMAPEQIRDASAVDQRADLFSLGCILYNLVTRRPPFDSDDVVEVFRAIEQRRWVPVRDLVPDLPENLQAAIEACMQVDPDDRPENCEALLELLDMPPSRPPATELVAGTLASSETPSTWTDLAPRAIERTPDLPGPAASEPEPDPWFRGPAASQPPTPRVDPTPSPATWARVFLFLGGALAPVGLAVGLLPGLLTPASSEVEEELPALPCGGRPGEVVGYLYGGKHPFFSRAVGTEWELTSDREVARDHPHEGNDFKGDFTTVCELPRRTILTVVEPTIHVRGSGVWVPVVADALALPAPEEADALPSH